ncbi:MAG: hypothetical protein HKM93_23000 [Desulfobacteraceae bacterium]|nr:hypothetical protein [Desulfobacteraceae bacterium]
MTRQTGNTRKVNHRTGLKRTEKRATSWQSLSMMILAMAGMVFLSACGGSGGGSSSGFGGDVDALSIPSRVMLTRAEDDSVSASTSQNGFSRAVYTDEGTDYTNLVKDSWVDDTDALEIVNDILGVVQDTAYGEFMNDGPYLALVKKVGDSEQSQTGQSSTNATTEELMEMVVDVTRESNDDPMIVKIWVKESDGSGGNAMLIRGYFEVTEGVSDEYPYGAMEAHFTGTPLDGNGNELDIDAGFEMAMRIGAAGGSVTIELVEDGTEPEGFYSTNVNVLASSDLTEGKAYIEEEESWGGGSNEMTAWFAYNDDYFKVDEDDVISVYSKSDLVHKIYRYRLFDEDGALVERNSGFPIRFEDGGHGYAGYHGIWSPFGGEDMDGETVIREGTFDQYTIVQKAGKLIKHSKEEILLSKLNGIELSTWDCDESGCQDLVVKYDSTAEEFVKRGYRNEETNWNVEPLPIGEQTAVAFEQWEGAWAEALRAYLPLGSLFNESGDLIDPEGTLSYHNETTVVPGSDNLPVNATLHHFGPATPGSQDWSSPDWREYTFDASAMMLKNGAEPIVFESGSDNDWGWHIMPLVPDADWSESMEPHEVWNLDVFYSWTTGEDDWNKLTVLQDGDGDYVAFDAPLRINYTHQTGYDINYDTNDPNDGKIFGMEWDGFDLMIPWKFDEDHDDWFPVINLRDSHADGPSFTVGSNTYYVKAAEESLVMSEVDDISVANSLEIDYTLTATALEYDASKTELVGAYPTSVDLEVIKGELVNAD